MLTGEIKQFLVDLLVDITKEHQQRRSAVTDNDVKQFMDPTRSCFDRFKKAPTVMHL